MTQTAIVGTSNAMLRSGWGKALEACAPGRGVSNYSLPGNCSLFVAHRIRSQDIARRFDHCVIDCGVNDHNFIANNYITREQACAYFAAALAQFAAPGARCVPLVLLYANVPQLGAWDQSNSRGYMLGLCRAFGVPVLDLAPYVSERAERDGPAAVFTDGNHFTQEFSLLMADLVHCELSRLPRTRPVNPGVDAPEVGVFGPGEVTVEDCAVLDMQSSLFSMQAVELRQGGRIIVQTGADRHLCGLMHWSLENTGHIAVSGGHGRVVKNMSMRFSKAYLAPVYNVAACRGPRLEIALTGGEPPTERTRMESPHPLSDGGEARVLLGDLLCCDRDPDQCGRRLLDWLASREAAPALAPADRLEAALARLEGLLAPVAGPRQVVLAHLHQEELRHLLERCAGIAPPLYFNEETYLALHADVRQAVAEGRLPSGFVHWMLYGFREGREIR